MKRLFAFLFVLALILLAVTPVLAGENVFVTLHQADWVRLALELTGAAAWLTNLTKTDKDDRALGWFSKIVHFLAGSFKVSGLK